MRRTLVYREPPRDEPSAPLTYDPPPATTRFTAPVAPGDDPDIDKLRGT